MTETHVVSALRKKRSEVAGHVHDLEKKIATWRARLAHIDETIKIFSPETDPEAIPPKRTYRRARYFSRGEFARLCLDALRKSERPLTTAEIVASVIRAKGLPNNLSQALTEKTLAYLRTKLATASVVKTGITQGARWAISERGD
jgi:hypothetical protein